METLEYKDGRIYETKKEDITGNFDLASEIARLTKERDELTAKIVALTGAKIDIDKKAALITPVIDPIKK